MSTRFWRSPSFEQTWFPFTQGCLVPSLVKTLKLNIFLLLCLMTLEKMCSLLIFLSHCQTEKKLPSPEPLFSLMQLSSQLSRDIERSKFFSRTSRMTLNFDSVTCISGIHCTKFGNFTAKGSKETITCIEQTFVQIPAVSPDLWPCDLKINREHLLSRGIKFGNFQSRGQNVLSGHRQSGAKQDALFIQRGAWNYIDENIYILG